MLISCFPLFFLNFFQFLFLEWQFCCAEDCFLFVHHFKSCMEGHPGRGQVQVPGLILFSNFNFSNDVEWIFSEYRRTCYAVWTSRWCSNKSAKDFNHTKLVPQGVSCILLFSFNCHKMSLDINFYEFRLESHWLLGTMTSMQVFLFKYQTFLICMLLWSTRCQCVQMPETYWKVEN